MIHEFGKTAAIVISYNDANAVTACVLALQHQVDAVIVVDNGSAPQHREKLAKITAADVISLTENKGLAAAMNIGLDAVRSLGADWVLLMDQDSIVAPDLVDQMLKVSLNFPMATFTPSVAALGAAPGQGIPHNVNFAITSGNLVPMAALDAIGGLDAGLFIDGVDFDMSLKLRKAGYQIIRVPAAQMDHNLGDAPSQTPVLGRFHTNHSPLRRYYMVRNFIHNARRHATSFPLFFSKLAIVMLLSFGSIMILGPKRWASFTSMALGLGHGLTGRLGPK